MFLTNGKNFHLARLEDILLLIKNGGYKFPGIDWAAIKKNTTDQGA